MTMRIPLVDLKAQYVRIRPEIETALHEVVESCRFVGGPEVDAFESEWARFCEARCALGVSSGTSALHLALIGAGVGPGDEVLIPSHTFIATAEVVRRLGARARFVEITERTFTLDPSGLEAAFTPRAKAVIPVHLYGHPADMDPVFDFARSHGLAVIEDAAQAHGARYKGSRCGSLAPFGAFSFYPGKNLGAYGDGGAVTASDPADLPRLRSLSNHGRADKYMHEEEGYNYRLDAMQAAVLRVKLRHLETWNAERRRAAAWYNERLEGAPGLVLPQTARWAEHVFHLYVVRVPGRDQALSALKEAGIDAAIHYPVPLHLQPAYRHLGYREGDFPVTERIAREILSLPMYPEITEEQVDRVASALRRALRS
jgi:dTDP-4-amino-4,6-dideoxygalactose transaminase